MSNFYLIQRGSFRTNPGTKSSLLSGRDDSLIDPDYMGSAEFEFGAIPNSYKRIMLDNITGQNKYKLYVTDVKNKYGVHLCIYCKESKHDDILHEIKRYINKPYQLKERCHLADHFDNETHNKYELGFDFWWNIDRNDIGDWMAFLGAADRQNAFNRIICNDQEKFATRFNSLSENDKKEMFIEINRW